MSKLSGIEFAVMDEVYFPTSFEIIVRKTGQTSEQIRKTLTQLLEKTICPPNEI